MFNKILPVIALMAVAAAQTTPSKTANNTKPASQTVTNTSAAKATSKTASKPATPAKGAAKPAKTAAKSSPAPKPMAKQKVASSAKVKAEIQKQVAKPTAEKPEMPVKTAARRDPFVSPLRLQEDRMKQTSVCTTGARCLIIDQVVLKGIVKTPEGMIAMVENSSKKQYNLREKDPVYNGQVMKITGDSLIFRQTVTDNLGNQTTKEVVKKVTAPVI